MSVFYRAAYRFGFLPWDREAWRLREDLSAFFARVERRRGAPYGCALDVGCGTGTWSIELARRGWEVVGVDNVPRALHAARSRARAAGVDVAFVHGDATALPEAQRGTGYTFLLDVGCFHGLRDEQRLAMGRELSAVAAADASLLLLAWEPARRGPLPRGASAADIAVALPGWRIAEQQPIDTAGAPLVLKRAAPRWYRLHRELDPLRQGLPAQ